MSVPVNGIFEYTILNSLSVSDVIDNTNLSFTFYTDNAYTTPITQAPFYVLTT